MNKWVTRHQSWRSVLLRMLPTLLVVLMTTAVAFASSGAEKAEGEGRNWLNFGWRILNFVVLVWFLWWLLAQKLRQFFTGRRQSIKESLEEAIAAKEEAERKFAEYALKLEKATDEITNIMEMITTQGQAEKEKIIEDARRAAEKMKEDTQARMEQEFEKARNELRMEAVQLSVRMAEEILKRNITAEDHDNMVKDYLDKVVKEH